MSVDPHAKVTSTAQDGYVDLANAVQQLIMDHLKASAKPNPEELCRYVQLIGELRDLHLKCLSFDAELAGIKDKCGRWQGCSHGEEAA